MQGARPGGWAGQQGPEAGLKATTLAQRACGLARCPTSPSLRCPPPPAPGEGKPRVAATQGCSPGRGRRRGCSGPRGPRSPSRAAPPDLRGERTSPRPAGLQARAVPVPSAASGPLRSDAAAIGGGTDALAWHLGPRFRSSRQGPRRPLLPVRLHPGPDHAVLGCLCRAVSLTCEDGSRGPRQTAMSHRL